MKTEKTGLIKCFLIILVLSACGCSSLPNKAAWPQYDSNPFVIQLNIPAPEDDKGSIIVEDLNGDGLKDYLVTVPGHIAAYGHYGKELWILKADIRISMDAEQKGLPGQQAPGLQAVDVDKDKKMDVLFLTQDSILHVVDAASGKEKWTAKPPIPKGTRRWEHQVVGNFRGRGDTDLLLQTTNADGHRSGRYLTAYAIEDLKNANYTPLWSMDNFLPCSHTAARLADIDGDGRDEVIGGSLVSPEGKILYQFPLASPSKYQQPHFDAVDIDDIRPDIPGLEVVIFEEGDFLQKDYKSHILVANSNGLIWKSTYQRREPQDGAVGDFDPEKAGLEIFNRHRGIGMAAEPIPKEKFPPDGYQKPFVFDAFGNIISDYSTKDMPPEWTPMGMQLCQTIHWTGSDKALIAATERTQRGRVAIFDAIGGKVLFYLKDEKADRLHVADVSGDWREEMVILNGNVLHIYHNRQPNPNPNRPRLWQKQHYRRNKMTWNYSTN